MTETGVRADGGFRVEIQALRALAVGLVLVFHIWPERLPGGYIGVDVFFVISGFLITTHLLREAERSGRISLSRFWARRIRRLLPAAVTVLTASIVATLAWLPRDVWMQTFREIAASAIYVQNWVLANDSVDYLAESNTPTLVQHFWTLSVEEQFYLIWPILIALTLVLFKKPRAILIVLSVVALASFAFSVLETARSQPSAYFVTPTRAWEFAAGGLLAYAPALAKRSGRSIPALVRQVASWAGVLAIVGPAWLFDGETAFPGYAALLPVIGTAAVILAGETAGSWSTAHLARFAPVQALGDLSYSLYLWHWPLVVLYPVVQGNEPELRGGLVILAGSVVLAWLTKRFVEDPVRRNQVWSRSRRPAYILAAAGAALLVGASTVGFIHTSALFEQARAPKAPFDNVAAVENAIKSTLDSTEWSIADQPRGNAALATEWTEDGCLNATRNNPLRCTYGQEDAPNTAVLLGDSQALSFLPGLRQALEPEGWKIVVLTLGQCPAPDVAVHKWSTDAAFTECDEHREWSTEALSSIAPDLTLVVSATRSTYARLMSEAEGAEADREWADGFDRYLGEVRADIRDVVVLGDATSANCRIEYGDPSACRGGDGPVGEDRVDLERQVALDNEVRYVDTRPWFCTSDAMICPELIGNSRVRADESHLTATYSTRLAPLMREAILPR